MKIIITENQFKKITKIINEDNENKINVLFVGDSHSAGEGWTWNYQLAKEHPNWNTTNITKVGVKTDWMLSNLKNELSKNKFNLVFILGGTNDMMSSKPIDEAISNIQKMVDLTNQQGGKAIVVSGFDSATIMDPQKLKPTSYCSKSCQERFLERCIEFQKDLKTSISNAEVVPPLEGDHSWTNDGIHANTSKHTLLKNLVNQYVGETQGNNNKTEKNRKETFDKFVKVYTNLVGKGKEITKNSPTKDIRAMQIVLYIVTREDVKFNGVLDQNTQSVLKSFQSENNLNQTGNFDLKTIQKLTEKFLPGYKIQTSDVKSYGDKNTDAQKLLNDLMSKGVDENAAKGLVANAFGESRFNIQAKGDGGSYAQKSSKSIQVGDKKYCSFGLWQFNVCGGAGIEFLKKNGSSASNGNVDEKLKILFDYNKQLDYISEKIKPEQRKGDKDVISWVNWIVDNIERPSDKTGAKRIRGQFAREQGWA